MLSQMVFSILLIFLTLPLPESPRWLVKKGDFLGAAKVFAALGNLEVDDPSIEAQINEIRATLPLVDTAGIKEIFTQGKEKVNFRASTILRGLSLNP